MMSQRSPGSCLLQPVLEGKRVQQYGCTHIALLLTLPSWPPSPLNHSSQNWTRYSCSGLTDTLGVLPAPCVFIYHGMMFAFFITVQHCCVLLVIHYNPADPIKYIVPMQLSTHLLDHSFAVVLAEFFHALFLISQGNLEPQTFLATQLCVICICMSRITDVITEQNHSRKTSG